VSKSLTKLKYHVLSLDVIKIDVLMITNYFHSCGRWPKGCNASFVNFIPKVDNLQGLEVYKPISLVGTMYKIISKIILNCGIMKVAFKYLGLPEGTNRRRIDFWQDIITKIRKRLSLWIGKHIFFTGRVILMKSVLSTIPLHYLSLFKLPVSVEKTIKKIKKDFLRR